MVSTYVTITYATDEDVYDAGGGDYAVIVPESNRMAVGNDGQIQSSDLWTLTSATNNFASQGVKAGMVLQLNSPTNVGTQFLAVEAVGATSVSLRRCGMPLGQGLPPVPSATFGLTFKILTLAPQIEVAAYRLNQTFSVDPKYSGRDPGSIYDQRIFRDLTCYRVLYLQYLNLNRSKTGDFADKQKYYRDEYDAALATATVKWGPNGTSQPSTGRFGMRIER